MSRETSPFSKNLIHGKRQTTSCVAFLSINCRLFVVEDAYRLEINRLALLLAINFLTNSSAMHLH